MKKWISIFCFLLLNYAGKAQVEGYLFYAEIEAVTTSGFYNVELMPEITAHLKKDYSDIRVVNSEGKWIPHILKNEYKRKEGINRYALPFHLAKNDTDATEIVIREVVKPINNLILTIGNTIAERPFTISGSDDGVHWFVINDSIQIRPETSSDNILGAVRFYFPPANYSFYKITITNNGRYPYDVKKITTYAEHVKDENNLHRYFENPSTDVQQTDSGKISYIRISQKQAYHFDEISLQLTGPAYYSRSASLYIPISNVHSFAKPDIPAASFLISNSNSLYFKTSILNSPVFYLLIYNEDNLPLTIQKVNTYCSYRFIAAYLEAGKTYRLLMNNKTARQPVYDLISTDSSILFSDRVVATGKVLTTVNYKKEKEESSSNKIILWGVIIIVLLLLLYFTINMIKDINYKKSDDHL